MGEKKWCKNVLVFLFIGIGGSSEAVPLSSIEAWMYQEMHQCRLEASHQESHIQKWIFKVCDERKSGIGDARSYKAYIKKYARLKEYALLRFMGNKNSTTCSLIERCLTILAVKNMRIIVQATLVQLCETLEQIESSLSYWHDKQKSMWARKSARSFYSSKIVALRDSVPELLESVGFCVQQAEDFARTYDTERHREWWNNFLNRLSVFFTSPPNFQDLESVLNAVLEIKKNCLQYANFHGLMRPSWIKRNVTKLALVASAIGIGAISAYSYPSALEGIQYYYTRFVHKFHTSLKHQFMGLKHALEESPEGLLKSIDAERSYLLNQKEIVEKERELFCKQAFEFLQTQKKLTDAEMLLIKQRLKAGDMSDLTEDFRTKTSSYTSTAWNFLSTGQNLTLQVQGYKTVGLERFNTLYGDVLRVREDLVHTMPTMKFTIATAAAAPLYVILALSLWGGRYAWNMVQLSDYRSSLRSGVNHLDELLILAEKEGTFNRRDQGRFVRVLYALLDDLKKVCSKDRSRLLRYINALSDMTISLAQKRAFVSKLLHDPVLTVS